MCVCLVNTQKYQKKNLMLTVDDVVVKIIQSRTQLAHQISSLVLIETSEGLLTGKRAHEVIKRKWTSFWCHGVRCTSSHITKMCTKKFKSKTVADMKHVCLYILMNGHTNQYLHRHRIEVYPHIRTLSLSIHKCTYTVRWTFIRRSSPTEPRLPWCAQDNPAFTDTIMRSCTSQTPSWGP